MNTPSADTPETLFDPRWLRSEPVHVYKDDGRTKVWAIDTPRGRMVVKRFDRHALRQLATFLIHRHPAQVEARRVRQLQRAGLPVVSVIRRVWSIGEGGFRLWLIYPFAGKSLLWRLRDGDLAGSESRRRVIESLARLIVNLLEHGWGHTDLKTTNVLLDDAGTLWLIDTGAAERFHGGEAGRKQVAHMLATLDAGARKDRVSRADRLRLLRRVVELRPESGSVKELADSVARIVLK